MRPAQQLYHFVLQELLDESLDVVRGKVSSVSPDSVSPAGLDAASPAIMFFIGRWLLFVAGNSPGSDGLTREDVTACRLFHTF